MKRAELLMDQHRDLIRMVECQLNEELDDDSRSASAIRSTQYIDQRGSSMRTIAKHLVDWQLLSLH